MNNNPCEPTAHSKLSQRAEKSLKRSPQAVNAHAVQTLCLKGTIHQMKAGLKENEAKLGGFRQQMN